MKLCPNCNHMNQDTATYCASCGNDISQVAVQPEPAPVMNTIPVTTMAPPPVPIYEAKPKAPFSWTDVCSLIGFIASILGIFWCSVVLMPIGILLSLLGFLGTRLRGLSIAGLTISLLGALIKLCFIMQNTGIAPEWVTNGIFS